jgi:succinate dehydrogenase / fumarate reductase cytochrome b subunit
MAVSIFHRISGNGLATVGALGLVWWLMAAASGPEAYATFVACATSPLGYLVMVGITWAFFQHLFSGLRHFVLDMGAGYELRNNRLWSILVFVLAIVATAAVWAYIFAGSL